MRYLLVLILAGCGVTPSSPDAGGADAGTTARMDGGSTDPFAGRWQLSGSVNWGGSNTYMVETPITITRASDGNYRVQGAGCTMPWETVNTTTLRSVEATCLLTQANLTEARLNGTTPVFGGELTLLFKADGGMRLVADVLSVSGEVINMQFPNAPGTYSYSGTR